MNDLFIGMLPTLSVLATLGIGLLAIRIVDWCYKRKGLGGKQKNDG